MWAMWGHGGDVESRAKCGVRVGGGGGRRSRLQQAATGWYPGPSVEGRGLGIVDRTRRAGAPGHWTGLLGPQGVGQQARLGPALRRGQAETKWVCRGRGLAVGPGDGDDGCRGTSRSHGVGRSQLDKGCGRAGGNGSRLATIDVQAKLGVGHARREGALPPASLLKGPLRGFVGGTRRVHQFCTQRVQVSGVMVQSLTQATMSLWAFFMWMKGVVRGRAR